MKTRTHPVIPLIRSVPGFEGLSERQLNELVPLVDEITLGPGQVLTREGAAGREAFIVIEGQGDVFVDGEPIANVGPGEFVGEMAMLDHEPRCATVRAETPMRVLVISSRVFSTFLTHGGVARSMATQLSRRLRSAEVAGVERR